MAQVSAKRQEIVEWAEWRASSFETELHDYEERRKKQEAVFKAIYEKHGPRAVLQYIAHNTYVLKYFGYEVNTEKINAIEIDDDMLLIYLDAATVLVKICDDFSYGCRDYIGDYVAELDDTHYLTIDVRRG